MKAGIVPPPPKPDHTFTFEFSRSELAQLDECLRDVPPHFALKSFASQVQLEIDRLLKVPS